jgi:hypothetical protein
MAYDGLASGESFRIAVGNFMNDFFLYNIEQRQTLLEEPIHLPPNLTIDQRGWAAFCAGAAEYLAERYNLTCPVWIHDTVYQMPEPWYTLPSEDNPELREIFQATTPDSFAKRNVFCGDRIFVNQHPSSREPGNFTELQRFRQEKLSSLPESEREAYQKQMASKPRVRIVA